MSLIDTPLTAGQYMDLTEIENVQRKFGGQGAMIYASSAIRLLKMGLIKTLIDPSEIVDNSRFTTMMPTHNFKLTWVGKHYLRNYELIESL